MSITVIKDSKSMFLPLCQILKALCYSPQCCSVYKGLMQTSVTTALGVRNCNKCIHVQLLTGGLKMLSIK